MIRRMSIFGQLSRIRDFERAHLPFLVTLEDFDIVRTIGLHQERKETLLLKQLFLEDIGSIATVTRRLRRLRKNGKVLVGEHGPDRRVVVLTLSAPVHSTYLRYGKLLASLGA